MADIRYEQLRRMSLSELNKIFLNGHPVDMFQIENHQFLGLNVGVPAAFLKLFQKFVKCFYRDPETGNIRGWNLQAIQDGPDNPWQISTGSAERIPLGLFGKFIFWLSGIRKGKPEHGFYEVYPAVQDNRFNKYPNAILINYSQGKNGFMDITSRLKDYAVAVNKGDSTLLLGIAILDFGPVQIPGGGFFILRRGRKIDRVCNPAGRK